MAGEFAAEVGDVVHVLRAYLEDGVPVVEGRLRQEPSTALARLEARLAYRRLTPLIEDIGHETVRVVGLPMAVDGQLRRRSSVNVNLVLFLATVVTTVWAGALHQGINLLENPAQFTAGIPYAAALLGILGVHEMGHYVAARWHKVDVTLPYFIPVPMGLGTLGAFIQIKSLIKEPARSLRHRHRGPVRGSSGRDSCSVHWLARFTGGFR